MLDWLKTKWEKLFPPTPPALKPSPKAATPPLQPVAQPPKPTQNKVFVLSEGAAAYLDAAWQLNQNKVVMLPCGTRLWHGGTVGPNNPAINQRGLWATKDQQRKAFYNGWAKQEAKSAGVTAYLTEYATNKDISFADFNCYSMLSFTENFCNSNHTTMKQSLIAWVNAKPSLGGLIAINSGEDEVVVAHPEKDLNVVRHTPL